MKKKVVMTDKERRADKWAWIFIVSFIALVLLGGWLGWAEAFARLIQ